MKKSFDLGSALKNNPVSKTVSNHPVTTGVGLTYLTGSTIAYTAAGVSFGTALAYSAGVTLCYGAICYGGYHLVKKMSELDAQPAQ
jgi:hypothetical protein